MVLFFFLNAEVKRRCWKTTSKLSSSNYVEDVLYFDELCVMGVWLSSSCTLFFLDCLYSRWLVRLISLAGLPCFSIAFYWVYCFPLCVISSCCFVLCDLPLHIYTFLLQLMLKIILMDLWSLYALNRSQAIEHNMPVKNATTANEREYGWRMHGLCSNVHPHEFECMFRFFCVH